MDALTLIKLAEIAKPALRNAPLFRDLFRDAVRFVKEDDQAVLQERLPAIFERAEELLDRADETLERNR